jgi:hypothetical protein
MVFPIAGGNESKGYEISNSLRFNDGDSPKLEFTPSSTGNRRTFTFSFWFKRGVLGTSQYFFYTDNNGSGSTDFLIFINSSDGFRTGFLDSSQKYFGPSRVLRDPSAWYHAVVAVDTTQASASNRIKIYINGVEETDYAIDNRSDLGQNTELDFSRQAVHRISGYSSSAYIDGYLTEYHVVDGTALDATSFGEFDDNGVWIPKKYTGTYGTNGFFLEFKQTGTSANSSGIGADTSGNDNHFTPTNLAATDITEDTCTNNFATWNPLVPGGSTFSEANTTAVVSGTSPRLAVSSISVSKGKWYVEIKHGTAIAGTNLFGVVNDVFDPTLNAIYGSNDGVYFIQDGNKLVDDGGSTSYSTAYGDNVIFGIALNIDDNEITFYVDGSSRGTISKTFSGGYYIVGSHGSSSGTSTYQLNTGNPAFAISSGNSDANGYGNFEYAPPSGYYAICTKNLAEFG